MIKITNNLIERMRLIDGRSNIYQLSQSKLKNYAHFLKVFRQLEEKGIIKLEKIGKGLVPKFTRKGRIIFNYLNKSYSTLVEGDK